jgi:hypothetical protein
MMSPRFVLSNQQKAILFLSDRVALVGQAQHALFMNGDVGCDLLRQAAYSSNHFENLHALRRVDVYHRLSSKQVFNSLAECFNSGHYGRNLGAIAKWRADGRRTNNVESLHVASAEIGRKPGRWRALCGRPEISDEGFQIGSCELQSIYFITVISDPLRKRSAFCGESFLKSAGTTLQRGTIGKPTGKHGSARSNEPRRQRFACAKQAARDLRKLPCAGVVKRPNVGRQQNHDNHKKDRRGENSELSVAASHLASECQTTPRSVERPHGPLRIPSARRTTPHAGLIPSMFFSWTAHIHIPSFSRNSQNFFCVVGEGIG